MVSDPHTSFTISMKRVYSGKYMYFLSDSQTIKDKYLGFSVLALIVIDVVIIVLYVVIEGSRGQLQAVLVKNEEYPSRLVGVGHI